MKVAKDIKYLGDYLSNDLSESVHITVVKRLGLAKHSAYEIRAVIEDSRANKLGGINIGLKIFESSILSFLFHNSETWMDIPKKTVVLLDKFYNNFFRLMFRVCTGCPSPNFFWQTGFLRAENLILQKKLLFYHHLSILPEDSLGREILEIQKELSLPGLHREVKEHVERIYSSSITDLSKNVWKKKVKE